MHGRDLVDLFPIRQVWAMNDEETFYSLILLLANIPCVLQREKKRYQTFIENDDIEKVQICLDLTFQNKLKDDVIYFMMTMTSII